MNVLGNHPFLQSAARGSLQPIISGIEISASDLARPPTRGGAAGRPR